MIGRVRKPIGAPDIPALKRDRSPLLTPLIQFRSLLLLLLLLLLYYCHCHYTTPHHTTDTLELAMFIWIYVLAALIALCGRDVNADCCGVKSVKWCVALSDQDVSREDLGLQENL